MNQSAQMPETTHIPMNFRPRGGKTVIVLPDGSRGVVRREATIDNTMIKVIARGFRWQRLLYDGTYATIIGAPSSTKNADKARDPEMHQTRKGQQWYFGMKLHIGVDSQTGLSHSAVVTAANVHDKHPLPDLLHGNEQRVYGDSAYASQKALIASKGPRAKDFTNQRTRRAGEVDEVQRAKNRNKSRVRARVEHVFAVVKRLWGFTKVRYRGLQKNATRAFTALALANIYLCRGHLQGQLRP